jgi:two-component system KDP operon response regulator KdpE
MLAERSAALCVFVCVVIEGQTPGPRPLEALMASSRCDTCKSTLLIIDDDADLLQLLRQHLEARGYEVQTAQSGEESLACFLHARPDLVILDMMMPDMDGLAVCRWLRERSHVPILVLTALNGVSHLLSALALGADQYVTKPFAMIELEARLAALLRRAALHEGGGRSEDRSTPFSAIAPRSSAPEYDDGHLVIDLGRRTVTLDDRPVPLTATEFKILTCLTERAGSVIPHQEILSQVWGPEYIGDVAFLKTYIHHLRRKLRCDHADAGDYAYILNKWGVGYRLRAPNERENNGQWSAFGDQSALSSPGWSPTPEMATASLNADHWR